MSPPDTDDKKPHKNIIQRTMNAIDAFQQRHTATGFTYGVIKKYGEDEASYQGALITYYGFLSLFPLLIVATSFVQLLFKHNKAVQAKIAMSINHYFPVVGSQLQTNVHSSTKTGLTLLAGLLITLYGAKGVADAVQHALNHVWQVPRSKRPGFPMAAIKSLGIIVGGGLGLLLAAVLSSYATGLGHSSIVKIIPTLISILLLFGVFYFVFTLGVPPKQKFHDKAWGALAAAIGIQILQTAGGYLITHQLKNMNSLYGTFALVLGILFWIYLQTEVFLYATEINTVKKLELWPRSITQDPLTKQDRQAFSLYAKRESYRPEPDEKVHVKFQK